MQELNQDESSEDDMLIAAIEGKNKKDWNVTVKINSHNTRFKIDTGAQCNVMLSKTYQQLSQQPLHSSKSRLVTFRGHRLNSIGRTTLRTVEEIVAKMPNTKYFSVLNASSGF